MDQTNLEPNRISLQKQACLVIFMSLTLCLCVEPEGDAAVEDNEEQEDTEEQDEEKMKTSDEVEYAVVMTVLLLYIIHVLLKEFKHQ